MAWYKTGTISLVNGQTSVTGVGTKFASNARVGDGLRGPDGEWYEVVNIASETTLGIYPAYQGATIGGSSVWIIAPMQGYVKESADRLRDITQQYRDISIEVQEAKDAADAAKVSETNAAASESDALTARDTAVAARDAAKASETAAKTSETNSKTSETNSKTSETNAKTSETNAAASATAADTSRTQAQTAETNAKAAQTAAETARNAAQTSEGAAATSATNSANSATDSETSATNSANSATASKASEDAAKVSEANAKTSETAAADSQVAAKAAEDKAKEWATNPEDAAVETDQYSAFHWSEKARKSAQDVADITGPRLTSIATAVLAVNDMLIADSTNTMAKIATGAKGRELLGVSDEAAGRTSLGLGTAATRNVTLNKQDATEGSILQVGDFGLGQVGAITLSTAQLDDVTTPTGMYRFDTSVTYKGLPAGAYGLWNLRLNNTVATQIAIDYTNGLVYTRGRPMDNFSTDGGGVINPPLLSDFAAANIPTGWYRGFGDGHSNATPNAPAGSGNAAISIYVGSGFNSTTTSFLVITNVGSVNRVFHGNRSTAGAAPVWNQVLHVGDYGLGSYAARLTGAQADAATTIPSGFYDVTPQTTAQWANTPFPNAWTRMLNISHNNPQGYWTQLAFNFDTVPQMKVRGMSAGVRGSWMDVLTSFNGVTLETAQDIVGQKTFTGSQLRHRSSTPGIWMSPTNDSSYDDIWMVMSGNNLQWQRRANNFTSTLRSPTPMYLDLTSSVVRFGYNPIPSTDSSAALGLSGYRWSVVYSATGTINTSDGREKTPVATLSSAEISAAKALSKEVGTYKWLSAIQEKGDKARLHVGMTVQRAIEIMESNGLDPMAYGFICYDSWDATPENSYVEKRGYTYTLNEETGEEQIVVENVIEEANASPDTGVYWKYTHDDTVILNEAVSAGDRYSFRYDELNMFIAAGLNANQEELDARLAKLEAMMNA